MHTAELSFRYESPERADFVASAVGQELGEIDSDRATARLSQRQSQLSIEIDADDLVALRAGLNTWASLVEVAERMVSAGSD
mgnify:FL=1